MTTSRSATTSSSTGPCRAAPAGTARTASRGCARRSRVCTGTPGGMLADGTPFEACLGLGAMAEEVVVPGDRRGAAAGRRTARGVGAARLRDPHRRRCRAERRHRSSPATRCSSSVSAASGSRPSPGRVWPGAGRIIAVDVSDVQGGAGPHRRRHRLPGRLARPGQAGAGPDRGSRRRPGAGVRRLGDHDPSGLDRRTPGRHLRRRRRRPEGPAGHLQPARALPLLRARWSSSIYGNSDPRRDIAGLLEYVADGRLDLAATITDRITLDDVPAAFERMQRGEGGRALVTFPTPTPRRSR